MRREGNLGHCGKQRMTNCQTEQQKHGRTSIKPRTRLVNGLFKSAVTILRGSLPFKIQIKK